MTDFGPAKTQKKLPIVVAVVAVVLAAAAFFLVPRFERAAPQVKFTPDTNSIGLAPLQIDVADAGRGVKSLTATLTVNGAERPLASEQFAEPVSQKQITVSLGSNLDGLKEGPAVLRVVATDASLWNLFKGNQTVIEKNVAIDVTPPSIELIADDRYVNFGGVGVIVYKSVEDLASSGVKMGDYYFPGAQGQIQGHPDHYLVLFAHPYNAPPEARPVLVATDKAGNKREMAIAYELKDVRYRKSTINLSEGFLQKITPLLSDIGARQGTPQEVFDRINRGLRKVNEDKITAVTSKFTPQLLWKGAFTQLSNSKVEANFADERTYTWDKVAVNTAFHLGYDLSVTRNYPIEAANSGTVAFAGDLGIYGNVVILDHGMGLFTLYGHMSAIDVKVGDSVQQKQILGKTGETGLAAGDHLHYGVYLNGLAVLPVEWWDRKWIADNIEPKLAGKSGEAIAQEQQPQRARAGKASARAPAKAASRRRR